MCDHLFNDGIGLHYNKNGFYTWPISHISKFAPVGVLHLESFPFYYIVTNVWPPL